MKILQKASLPVLALAAASLLTACMDEVTPVNYITEEEAEKVANAQEAMLNGIIAFTNDLNSWGASGDDAYYLNDWGYPCQMMFRDVLTADFPAASTSYNYWAYAEQGNDLRYTPYYTYNYYYKFIKNCNNLIGVVDPSSENTSTASLNYLGCALTFRALCYLDMARLFEYRATGYAALDTKAEENGAMGLTVPIVTETTTDAAMRNNPRVPFYTMYRFLLSDLTHAAQYLDGYSRPNGTYPDQTVAYGLLARLWLEIGTRVDQSSADLDSILAHEQDADGFQPLGIASAADCYRQALNYAQLAKAGYTPMTQSEWTDPNTGFNTATDGWMLFSRVSTQEQEGLYYSNFIGTICTEAAWGMPHYGPYRMISKALYDKMGSKDWRKNSWIAPVDAGKKPASKYRVASWTKTDATTGEITTSDDKFADYPAYANLKFRTRDNIDMVGGMLCDLPMMRVEEMYFIEAEAAARLNGAAAGAELLKAFLNSYRYADNAYRYTASTLKDFISELFQQKRIEFWGEGLSLFDYKRLKMSVARTSAGNYLDAYQHDSKNGYVCPALNYYVLDYAKDQNNALVLNPDCSEWYELE